MFSDESLFESDDDILSSLKTTLNYLEECNVIAETPQKVNTDQKSHVQPKIKKLPTGGATTSETSNYTKDHVLHEFYVTRNDGECINTGNWERVNINCRYKNPYIFFDIKEVLCFSEYFQPLNSNIKIIGIYQQKRSNTHYLIEHRKNCIQIHPKKIVLDVKLLNLFPTVDQAVELYGYVDFYKDSSIHFPVFVVNFWSNVPSELNKYLKSLRRQKIYLPDCYKEPVTLGIDELSRLEISRNMDYQFEEIDEGWLNQNVEYLEKICQEIYEIMNISEDVFM